MEIRIVSSMYKVCSDVLCFHQQQAAEALCYQIIRPFVRPFVRLLGSFCEAISFYRATELCYSAVLGVIILSVTRSTVCLSHACFVTKPNNALRIFWYHTTTRKGNHSLVFCHQQWLVGDGAFRLKFALKVTHPFEKRRLRKISAYNVSTAKDSEKV